MLSTGLVEYIAEWLIGAGASVSGIARVVIHAKPDLYDRPRVTCQIPCWRLMEW